MAILAPGREHRPAIGDDLGLPPHDRDAEALDLCRQERGGDGDAVLHQHLVDVEVGAECKGHGQSQVAVAGRLRNHVEHVLDAVDLLLERGRDRLAHHLRGGAGVGGVHHDGRRGYLGILRHRQGEIGEAADQRDKDREHGREDRPVDEEVGKRLIEIFSRRPRDQQPQFTAEAGPLRLGDLKRIVGRAARIS